MTWNDALILIADKHKINISWCSSDEEREAVIRRKIEPARYQQYKLKYKYKKESGLT
jgi:hypothetical protein